MSDDSRQRKDDPQEDHADAQDESTSGDSGRSESEEEPRGQWLESADEKRAGRQGALESPSPFVESDAPPEAETEKLDPFAVPEFDIVDPPDEDEETDGFASIPAGPTEEVDFDEGHPRRGRKGRGRPRRAAGEPRPAPVAAAKKPKRIPAAVIAAAVVVFVLLMLLVFWMSRRTPKGAHPPVNDAPAAHEGP
jgi:hypothetical protein